LLDFHLKFPLIVGFIIVNTQLLFIPLIFFLIWFKQVIYQMYVLWN